MSTQNQISVEIPQEVINKVTEQLKDIKNQLAPYLQGLTAQERKEIFKMGDKTVATVSKVKSYMETNPEFVPAYMNKEEFLKDESVVVQLAPNVNLLEQLHSDTADTAMLAGSEAILSAMLYYGTVKEASNKGVATAKPIYEDLKARFSKKGNGKASPEVK
jgi:hypothetical protein